MRVVGEAVLDQEGALVDPQAHAVADEHQRLALDLAPSVGPRRVWRLGRGALPEPSTLRPSGFLASLLLSRRGCWIWSRRQIAPPLARLAVLLASRSATSAASGRLFSLRLVFGCWCRLVLHA